MKKFYLSLLFFVVGLLLIGFAIFKWNTISKNFIDHEMLFINGNYDTFLICLGILGIISLISGITVFFIIIKKQLDKT